MSDTYIIIPPMPLAKNNFHVINCLIQTLILAVTIAVVSNSTLNAYRHIM